tara:strand:+ start:129 stop:506 length:378 start_codon:yes stop_codon:yes gene_type:complete
MRDQHALASYALLFHGRLGRVNMPPSESIKKANKACAPRDTRCYSYTGAGYVSLLAASHFTHLISANAADGVDVFVHSWNPEMRTILDAAYGSHLRGSLHEQPNASLAEPKVTLTLTLALTLRLP